MRIIWSSAGRADAERLYAFLAEHDIQAADVLFDRLVSSPESLLEFPRRGSRLTEFDPREVRELRIGRYLLRYEIAAHEIFVLRFFHSKEDRF